MKKRKLHSKNPRYKKKKEVKEYKRVLKKVGKNFKIEVVDINTEEDSTNEAILKNISVIYSNKTLK